MRAGSAVDAFVEGGEEVVDGGGVLEGLLGGIGELERRQTGLLMDGD
jgi:hypothetical protein